MHIHSLRFRLLLFSAVVLLTVLAVAGFGLIRLFHGHLERRAGQELDTHISQIVGGLRFAPDGELTLSRTPADPRFQRPFGGLYWQIVDETSGETLRSRSLWDSELSLPADRLQPGAIHEHVTEGPEKSELLVHERLVLIPFKSADHLLRVSVAVDQRELDELSASFGQETLVALAVLGMVLLAGFAFQIYEGLRPMTLIRQGINDIRAGKSTRLSAKVPEEIRPLISELNALLESQEVEMARARDRAADLAHGLKTPLTALAADIRKLRDMGEAAIADDIGELADRMRRHMERELVVSRLHHGRLAPPLEINPAIEAVIRTIRRTPAGERLEFRTSLIPNVFARIHPDDIHEIVGNLADNASRYAESRVSVTTSRSDGEICIAVEDDGPGIEVQKMAGLSKRGKRLDEQEKGTGLGLAIVHDIVDHLGGRLEFAPSPMGGLSVKMWLPAVEDPSGMTVTGDA
jgi:signal transduction histidine kinase